MERNDESPAFLLKGENNDFSNRCKDIFSNLKAYEDKHSKFEQSRAQSDASEDHKLLLLEADSTVTETIMPTFQTPKLPSSRGCHKLGEGRDLGGNEGNNWDRRVDNIGGGGVRSRYIPKGRWRGGGIKRKPDFEVHPDKWTRYSLEDVKDEDMSNSANQKAALSFLSERKAIREAENACEKVDVDSNACSKGAFTFKNVKKTSTNSSEKNEKDSLKESAEEIVCSLDDTDEKDTKDDSDIKSKMIFKSRKPSCGKSIRSRILEEDEDET